MTATPVDPGRAMRLAALWGDQHARREQDVVTRVDEHSALAISAGSELESGPPDPSRDAALVLATPHARLLAVAGGERGSHAARAALLAVAREGVRQLGRAPGGASLTGHGPTEGRGRRVAMRPWRRQPGGPTEAGEATAASVATVVNRLLDAARAAVERTAVRPEAAGAHGQTALSIALVAGESVCTATVGDACVIRLHGHTVETLTARTNGLGSHTALPRPVNVDLSAGDRLVLATDGFLQHVGQRWPRIVMAAVGSGSDPSGATSRLLQADSDGGSPRDVAVALTSVASPSPNGARGSGTDDALELLVPTA